MEKHYQKMLRDTEDRVVKSLQIQVLDRESPRYGGFADPTGIVQAKFAIYRIAGMAAAYCNEDTCFYRDGRVYDSILKGLDYVARVQHESGLFDYITCNFFSAPDTAFASEASAIIPVSEVQKGQGGRAGADGGRELYPGKGGADCAAGCIRPFTGRLPHPEPQVGHRFPADELQQAV